MNRRDVFDFILLSAIWGTSFLFMRVSAPEFGAFALIGLRAGIAIFIPRGQRAADCSRARAHGGRFGQFVHSVYVTGLRGHFAHCRIHGAAQCNNAALGSGRGTVLVERDAVKIAMVRAGTGRDWDGRVDLGKGRFQARRHGIGGHSGVARDARLRFFDAFHQEKSLETDADGHRRRKSGGGRGDDLALCDLLLARNAAVDAGVDRGDITLGVSDRFRVNPLFQADLTIGRTKGLSSDVSDSGVCGGLWRPIFGRSGDAADVDRRFDRVGRNGADLGTDSIKNAKETVIIQGFSAISRGFFHLIYGVAANVPLGRSLRKSHLKNYETYISTLRYSS
jgi:hypothetical protein